MLHNGPSLGLLLRRMEKWRRQSVPAAKAATWLGICGEDTKRDMTFLNCPFDKPCVGTPLQKPHQASAHTREQSTVFADPPLFPPI
jgi:hypothetical protein